MVVSLNPSYLCNFRCSFCYLSNEELSDKKLLPLDKLESLLEEVSTYREITHIDLYGGEPSLLPKRYLEELTIITMGYVEQLHVNTNLSTIKDIFLKPFYRLCVSYDFHAREEHEKVYRNMLTLSEKGIPFSILTLASQEVIKMDTDKMCEAFSKLSTLETVEIKPYSQNQNNQDDVRFVDYERFLIRFIQSCKKYGLVCTNEKYIEESLNQSRNAFSDDHVYINPNGLAVLEFDLNDREYFKELDSIDDYIAWTKIEKKKVKGNTFCQSCRYYGHCLSEHLRDVKDLTYSCNGFYHLLEHYRKKGKE